MMNHSDFVYLDYDQDENDLIFIIPSLEVDFVKIIVLEYILDVIMMCHPGRTLNNMFHKKQ